MTAKAAQPIPQVLNAAANSLDRKLLDEVLWWIHECLSAESGEGFFRELIGKLCSVYGMRHAFITRCLDHPVTRVRTLAYWSGAGLRANASFALAGLPCERLLQGTQPMWIREDLGRDYPGKAGWAEGYCGLPLLSGDNTTVIGHIAFFSPGAMARNVFEDPLLHIFCARATAELRRLVAEEAAQDRLAQLTRSARLAELGHLHGLIAHELTQPLSAISMRARAAQRELEAAGASAAAAAVVPEIDAIARQAERASDIVRNLRQLARAADPEATLPGRGRAPPSCDANAAVADAMLLFDSEAARRGVLLHAMATPGLQPVVATSVDLQQVLCNLLRNAMDALSGYEPALKAPRQVWLKTWAEGGLVFVTVADNGPGVEPLARARLFDAFFTTKPQGVGLGLSLCRELLARHDAHLMHAEPAGGGAQFTLVLKVAA